MSDSSFSGGPRPQSSGSFADLKHLLPDINLVVFSSSSMTECQLGVTRLLRCGWNYLQLSNHWDCGKQKPRFLLRLLRPDQPYEVLRVCSASLAIRFLRSCSAILCQMWNIAALAFTTKKSLTQACWRLLTAEGPGEVVKDVGWEHTAQNAPLPLSGIHFCPLLLSDLWWISHIGPMALYLQSISALFSWALVSAFMEVRAGGGGLSFFPRFFSNYFSKEKECSP